MFQVKLSTHAKAWGGGGALLWLLFRYLMGNLRIEAIEMKHMDPTDIVLVPFDLQRLANFVGMVFMASLLALIVMSRISLPLLAQLLVQWIQGTLAAWLVCVVCGTPPTLHVYHTVWASAYLSTLCVGWTTWTCPQFIMEADKFSSLAWWQRRLPLPELPPSPKSKRSGNHSQQWNEFGQHFIAVCQLHATVFVTVPFQVLRLYDWGSQIQRWPLPLLLGSTYGYVVGSVLGSLILLGMQRSFRFLEMYDAWIHSSADSNPHQD